MKRVLAVASGGGHWVQLLRMRAAFAHHDVHFLTTNAAYAKDVDAPLHAVIDASSWTKLRLVWMFMQVLYLVLRLRPQVVITTGAAPGLAAICCAKLVGAKTIWVDSIANSEQLSGSGRHAGRLADVWLTQWADLATAGGPQCWGSVV